MFGHEIAILIVWRRINRLNSRHVRLTKWQSSIRITALNHLVGQIFSISVQDASAIVVILSTVLILHLQTQSVGLHKDVLRRDWHLG